MRRAAKSFRHAIAGVLHALITERNFPLFLIAYPLVFILGWILRISGRDWVFLVMAGGMFLAIELLNTAIERLSDTLDDYQKKLMGSNEHPGLKMTKDVASAAALMSLLTVIAVVLVVLLPPLLRLPAP